MYFFMAATSLLLYRQHLHDHFAVHHCFHFQQINALQTRFPDIFCANITGDALRIPNTAGKTKGSFEKKKPKQWTNHKGNPSKMIPYQFSIEFGSLPVHRDWDNLGYPKKTIRFFVSRVKEEVPHFPFRNYSITTIPQRVNGSTISRNFCTKTSP